jgi:hypothetical protein
VVKSTEIKLRKTEEINRLKSLQKQIKTTHVESGGKTGDMKVAISSEVLRIAQKFVHGNTDMD